MIINNVRRSVKHIFAALLFCFVLSMAMVCLADEKGTVKVESAKVREKADTSSNQVGSVAKGGTVDIVGETTGADGKTWYQINANGGIKGYVRADLVNKSGGQAANTAAAPDEGANAAVTPVDAKAGTVTNNSVYVRKSASTNSADIATVSKGIVLTVTGEAKGNDGKKWYQVTFKHNDKEIGGFIRADLVTFENVPADPAVSEITGTGEGDGGTPPETQQPQEAPEPPKQENNGGANENDGIIFMNVEEVPYIMPGFELVNLDWNGQKINAYRNGTFFIVYAQKQNGDEGWYMLDREKNIYQRYPYTVENVTVPKEAGLIGSPVPMIVMAAVIVVMLIVIVVLFLKLNGRGGYYEEEEDDDDYPEEDDDDDIEEIEEDTARFQPARRTQPPLKAQERQEQPARRTQPPQHGQQERIGQQAAAQPVRRPQPPQEQGQQDRPAQRQQPIRRPSQPPQGQGQQERIGQQPVRRPQPPQGQGQQDRPAQRRPAPPSGRPASNVNLQKGRATSNGADKDDDDMNFVDI